MGSFLTCCFQAAVYGIGICAEFGGSAFRPHTGGMGFTHCESGYFIVSVVVDVDFIFMQRHCPDYTM